jgi:two-component system, LytTR family, sensor kinase
LYWSENVTIRAKVVANAVPFATEREQIWGCSRPLESLICDRSWPEWIRTGFKSFGYILGATQSNKQVKSALMKMARETFRWLTKSYAVSLGIWMSIGFFSVVQQRVNHPNSALGWPLVVSVVAFFFASAVLTPPVFYLGRKYPLARQATIRRILLYISGAPFFVVAYACVRWVLAPPYDQELHHAVARSLPTFLSLITSNFANLWWVYLEILLAANAFEYFERARTESLEKAQLEQALAASELQSLKAQIQPHFLFNTLHGIATLADTDGARAKAMVLQLASLLRAALEQGNSDLITLRDELQFIKAYLNLEKMRLGERLDIHWSIDPRTQDALVPQLILQPLVENAIIHGVSCSRTGGFVEIDVKQEGESLVLTVRNSLGGVRPSGTGLGLRNTESRLSHLYGSDASLKFTLDQKQRAATAIVRLPLLVSTGAREDPLEMEA